MIEITENEFSADEVIERIISPRDGAIVTFTGVVRCFSEGKRVERLKYEAYKEMALKGLKRLRETAIKKFGISDVAIVHRIGTLKPGEIILFIAVAGVHRDEAFKACMFIIDALKREVPIWKKEFYDYGEEWVGV